MALLLKLLGQKGSTQDEGFVSFPILLQVGCDLQDFLTLKFGYLEKSIENA